MLFRNRWLILTLALLFGEGSLWAVTYPHVVLGGGFEVQFLVTNKLDIPWTGRLLLRQGNDASWESEWILNGRSMTGSTGMDLLLEAGATMEFLLSGSQEPAVGYAELIADPGFSCLDITPFFYLRRVSNSKVADLVGVPPVRPEEKFTFPVVRRGPVNTSFAWAPFLDTGPFDISIRLYDANGTERGVVVRPFEGHFARYFDEVFSGLEDPFRGKVLLESDAPIYLIVLQSEVDQDRYQLTTIPADDLLQ